MSRKRLFRSPRDGMLAGVSAGMAQYFDVDPSIVRLVFILFTFFGGAGLFLYLVAWFIVPENPEESASASYLSNQKLKEEVVQELRRVGGGLAQRLEDSVGELESHPERRSMMLLGLALVAMGVVFLLRHLVPWLELAKLWPLALIALGGLLLLGAARREGGA